MTDDLVLRGSLAAALAEESCDCAAHAACAEVVARLDESASQDARARAFDLRRVCTPFVHQVPEASWPTAALLDAARTGLNSLPWVDSLRRSTRVTQALGILGERGLLADAYVRLYLSKPLARRVVAQAAHAFVHARESGRDRESYPVQVNEWFPCLDQLDMPKAPLTALTSAALSGEPMERALRWLEHAAMAHIVEWRATDFLSVEVDPRDAVLPGGRDATIWVFDRFSHTSSADWRRGSAEWEVAFAREPARVAEFVGVARSVLDERPSALEMALGAQVSRFLSHGEGDEAARGLMLSEMVEQILAAIQRGDLETAISEAKHAHALAPKEFATTNALAFCYVPDKPSESLHILADAQPQHGVERQLLRANVVSTQIALGDWGAAADAIESVQQTDDEAFLWDAQSIVDGVPEVRFVPFGDWFEAAERLISSRTQT